MMFIDSVKECPTNGIQAWRAGVETKGYRGRMEKMLSFLKGIILNEQILTDNDYKKDIKLPS